jgi:hypothetical protein
MRNFFIAFIAIAGVISFGAPPSTPTFEIMTGKAAEEKIRLLFDGASEQNPFLFEGTTPDGKTCTLTFETPSDSEFIVSMNLTGTHAILKELAGKVIISKMASLTRATRSFDSYFSEHYKLFIPSGTFDILEFRKRHDESEYQLVFQSSLDQKKWVA